MLVVEEEVYKESTSCILLHANLKLSFFDSIFQIFLYIIAAITEYYDRGRKSPFDEDSRWRMEQ